MFYLAFIVGVIVGAVLSNVFSHRSSGYGYFTLEPYDDDDTGFYSINIRVPQQENLEAKKYILLHRENSQK